MTLYVVLIVALLILAFLIWSHFTKPGQAELASLEARVKADIAAARADIASFKSKLKVVK